MQSRKAREDLLLLLSPRRSIHDRRGREAALTSSPNLTVLEGGRAPIRLLTPLGQGAARKFSLAIECNVPKYRKKTGKNVHQFSSLMTFMCFGHLSTSGVCARLLGRPHGICTVTCHLPYASSITPPPTKIIGKIYCSVRRHALASRETLSIYSPYK